MSDQPERGWRPVRRACAIASAVLVAGLAGLHAHWAAGGTWGATTGSDGTFNADESLPLGSRPVTWGLVVLLVVAAALVLVRAGLLHLGVPRWVTIAGCASVALFALLMLGASVGDLTDPASWTSWLFGPMAFVLFALTLVVAVPTRGSRVLTGMGQPKGGNRGL